MNQPSRHTELVELLPAAALEILGGEELDRVESHARECGECARLLREYREAVASIGVELPPGPLDPGSSQILRERLLARAGGRVPPAHPGRPMRTGSTRTVPPWTGWAVAAGLAGVLLVHHGFHRPLAYGWIVAGLLAIILVCVGAYALAQRGRVTELERSSPHGSGGGPSGGGPGGKSPGRPGPSGGGPGG